jgi:hypothetical protein
MALEEFEGAITMELDGREIDCTSLSVRASTGRRLVRTMNKTGNAAGFVKGVTQFDLTVTVVVPKDGKDVDWDAITGAKITREPIGGGQRHSYLDCFTTEVGQSFEVDGEARKTISMHALREVKE